MTLQDDPITDERPMAENGTIGRRANLQRVFDEHDCWDVIIVGGGATGIGAAVDAASRGYRCALFEQSDFGKGTSSRSTKLLHGGVRYLRQGRMALVREALRERSILFHIAPHLVRRLPLLVPAYQRWELPYYAAGLAIYSALSTGSSFGRSRTLSRRQVLAHLPTLNAASANGLRGGVLYHDGQFDDARLLINLAQTAADHGAAVLNYVQVLRTIRGTDGMVRGVHVRDLESGQEAQVLGRCVINATGAFCDELRRCDEPGSRPIVTLSQGAHIVLDQSFLPGHTGITIPRTSDGRVVFAIPWHGHVLVGTTDTPIENASLEPKPLAEEVDFLLSSIGRYVTKPPSRCDVLSAFAGIRPLAGRGNGATTATTSELSRDHMLEVSRSGLITIVGGKWTTYRSMARECIDLAAAVARLPRRACVTARVEIRGAEYAMRMQAMSRDDPQKPRWLDAKLAIDEACVRWAARHEAARTVDDILARRTRALQLNARSAIRMAPEVARLLAEELGRDPLWQRNQIEQFRTLAANYIINRSFP
jgi:glycerol-3-phosphate dehydrogenase